MALGHEKFMLRRCRLFVRDVLGVQHIVGRLSSPRCAQYPAAFAPGGGGEPARKCGRLADGCKLVHELQPYALADVLGVGAAELVPMTDRPNERGVPLDEYIPRLLVVVSGACHQISDRRAAAYRV